MEVKERVTLDFYNDDIRLSDEFLVGPNLSKEAAISAPVMKKWRIKLNFEQDTIIINPEVAKLLESI